MTRKEVKLIQETFKKFSELEDFSLNLEYIIII